ncbi:MAG: biotin/lipoyl-binding protein [Armatimonadetes bacterium]|nr:biotin/lipoyl-binding protein [Armatimonadota bacterium]
MPAYEVEWEDQVAVVEVAGDARDLTLTFGGRRVAVEMIPVAPGHCLARIDGTALAIAMREDGDGLVIDTGWERYRLRVRRRLPIPTRRGTRGGRETARAVPAPMPGLLVSVEVREGDPVRAGQVVAIMEAMKMRMEIRAPAAGTVKRVHARGGVEITGGQPIVTLE